VSNLGLLFNPEESQSLVQSGYHEPLDLLQERVSLVGHFGAMPQPLLCQSTRMDHTGCN